MMVDFMEEDENGVELWFAICVMGKWILVRLRMVDSLNRLIFSQNSKIAKT
jgi:hypothetical protein